MDFELGTVQERFADIVWANEPVGSGELVKLCNTELGWKKSTTYTVLRKLCDKGLFKNEDGIDELGFKDKDLCENFIHDVSKLWPSWVEDEDRLCMQL